MNDLEMVTSKIVSAREILDSAIDRLQENQYDKVETLMYAVDEYLVYYLEEFDRKFKLAWQETVVKKNIQDMKYDAMYSTEDVIQDMDNIEQFMKNKVYESPDKGKTVYERTSGQTDKKFQSKVVTVDADGVMELPQEMLDSIGVSVGDYVQWIDNGDGSFLLKKIDNVSRIEHVTVDKPSTERPGGDLDAL